MKILLSSVDAAAKILAGLVPNSGQKCLTPHLAAVRQINPYPANVENRVSS